MEAAPNLRHWVSASSSLSPPFRSDTEATWSPAAPVSPSSLFPAELLGLFLKASRSDPACAVSLQPATSAAPSARKAPTEASSLELRHTRHVTRWAHLDIDLLRPQALGKKQQAAWPSPCWGHASYQLTAENPTYASTPITILQHEALKGRGAGPQSSQTSTAPNRPSAWQQHAPSGHPHRPQPPVCMVKLYGTRRLCWGEKQES